MQIVTAAPSASSPSFSIVNHTVVPLEAGLLFSTCVREDPPDCKIGSECSHGVGKGGQGVIPEEGRHGKEWKQEQLISCSSDFPHLLPISPATLSPGIRTFVI